MWQHLLLMMLLGPVQGQPAQAAPQSTCIRCHEAMGGPLAEPVTLSKQDIHFQNGLSCVICHGGDPTLGIENGGPEDSMNPRKGFVGRPARSKIAALCASCHSKPDFMRQYSPRARVDQYSEYLTSVHGIKNQAGDPNVATCSDCHHAHGILAVTNPNSPVYAVNVAATCGHCHSDAKLMAPYGIPTDQQELYSKSVHGEALMTKADLSAPTCNDCHGNHGAVPPGVDSVANVCGQCHVTQWDMFGQSPHKAAFMAAGLPGCVTCHQNHEILHATDAMLGVQDPALCGTCHDPGSPGYLAAQQMKEAVTRLQTDLTAANEILERAQRAGMEVSSPIYELSQGRNKLVLARNEVHRFNAEVLLKTAAEGETIAAASEQSGVKALQDLAYRRKGMAVSAGILLFMIGLLLVKIRQLRT